MEAITTRQHVGRLNDVFRARIDWGLVVYLDSQHYEGPRQTRFATHSSWRTFGHGGAGGVLAFGDPAHGLAVALFAPSGEADAIGGGAPNKVASAIYEDLGLSS